MVEEDDRTGVGLRPRRIQVGDISGRDNMSCQWATFRRSGPLPTLDAPGGGLRPIGWRSTGGDKISDRGRLQVREWRSLSSDSPTRPGSPAWLSGGAALLAISLFWLVRNALIDDAYITLSYARNLATHLHWGLILTERANAATSPLNVLLLAGATALLRLTGGIHPVWALGLVFVGSTVALAWGWSQVAAELRLPLLVPAHGVALVLLNPLVLSSTGLEVLLIPAVLVGMLAMAVSGRPVAFGVLSGLAVLTRLDLVVFVLPLALVSPGIRHRLAISAGTASAVSLPWFVWSWWHFGSAIPDTFAIKTVQRAFGPWTFANGPLDLLERYPLETVAFAPALLGLVALLAWTVAGLLRRSPDSRALSPAVTLGVAGAIYYAAYARLGVPPYQWYYVPSVAALSTSLCVLLGAALRAGPVARRAVALPGLALVACLVLGNLVADVRGGVPWRVPLIFGNWATPRDYARVGRELGERVGPETVISPGEIGTLAYFCQCSIVDAFADRGRVVPLIEERIAAAGPVMAAILKVNYLRLDRDEPARPAAYRLIWEPGPATQPEEWQTWSPSAGVGHFRLERVPVG